ncbi:SMP-30/gluconolactonase/LRE family protein [Oceanispirochaeta sp.]|jgi:sugar lactone lactonase YvrE|uniref:SMP-30/gluconolactonase/LRE family protein n=1 Tax=Oceanispirochaeta sp. TaxID=2035350 RepID=UPI00260CAD0B|nr:SMP-30/gluconolactonase/LRE family protein [Oceanispirochaeta sp.]MDA3957000.1 SMP-30/gluconolactonase/LRE family protein [Oceanispirochaeta sp.]
MQTWLAVEGSKKTQLGEGPLWDDKNQVLYFVDIEGKNIRRYDPESRREDVLPAPQRVGSLFLDTDSNLLAALEDGIYYADKWKPAHQKIKIKGDRFNDGKTGPDGCIYAGTIGKAKEAAFYKLTPGGEISELFSGITCSNGLDWSLDEKTMYYIDTPTLKIDAFDFDGTLTNRRTIYEFGSGEGFPDGMCIDMNGILHVALWTGRAMVSIDPISGRKIETTSLPSSKITCMAFGGTDMKTMYITIADIDNGTLLTESLAGQLLSRKYHSPGRVCYRFG